MKRIVLVSSGQPSANPRLVKEATALDNAGYKVTVLYVPLSPWADMQDQELFAQTPGITWKCCAPHQIHFPTRYKLVRARRKAHELLNKTMPVLTQPQYTLSLNSQEIERCTIREKADIYIGHNLAALPAVVKAAKKHKAKCAFDAEDYHRGEDSEGSLQHQLSRSIEEKYFPQVDYLSAASPLIAEKYQLLFSRPVATINNVFSKKYIQPVRQSPTNELHLFWFSQTIGANRGLEVIVDAINKIADLNIHIHLLGQCSDGYRQKLKSLIHNTSRLHFLPPANLAEIFSIASQFDIGLAAEVPYCENREICLTNKIFTYLLSSLCVLASDTQAQKKFMEDNTGVGFTYPSSNAGILAGKLKDLYENRNELQNCKMRARELAASTMNWEVESAKFLKIVHSTLSN